MSEAAFFELYHPGLPRLGPGSSQDTARALALVPGLSDEPLILDVGCGNGAQTLALARLLPHARIAAIDLYPHFLEELRRRACQEGVGERIEPVLGDMSSLNFQPESFDLIWSEGAAYHIGFAVALSSWRTLLKPGGCIALTDISWFHDAPPAEVRDFWNREFPGMESEASHQVHVHKVGFDLLGQFRLPAECWWKDYYTPLSMELAGFRLRHADKPEWLAVADMAQEEMDIHRRYSDYFGYTFFVCRRRD